MRSPRERMGREERSEKRLFGQAFVSPARRENRSQQKWFCRNKNVGEIFFCLSGGKLNKPLEKNGFLNYYMSHLQVCMYAFA